MSARLRRVRADQIARERVDPVDDATLREAAAIVERVRRDGDDALRAYAAKFGELSASDALVHPRSALEHARDALPQADREVLERVAERVRTFARAQRESLVPMSLAIPGGRAGQALAPVATAGCYAPGGRFPLPSSVIMTAVTAREAGVPSVWVASPRPGMVTLAAAAVAGADAVLAVGGAHAIAALAYGTASVPACDVVVGPGNRWVTAAKKLVSGAVGIDMLAGPSELVVLADGTSGSAAVMAADLLAQAEHDPDALPVLVTTDARLADDVDAAIESQLSDLETADTARSAVANGMSVVVQSEAEAIEVVDRLAPEHLQVVSRNASALAARCRHYGAIFIGDDAAEVLGDYGAGPNHVLPTGTVARYAGGLSVFAFVRVRTWIEVNDLRAARGLYDDAEHLAKLEGLHGHARAAKARRR